VNTGDIKSLFLKLAEGGQIGHSVPFCYTWPLYQPSSTTSRHKSSPMLHCPWGGQLDYWILKVTVIWHVKTLGT